MSDMIYTDYDEKEASDRRAHESDKYMNLSGCHEDDVRKLVSVKGSELSMDICMEECAELIQSISKVKRGKKDLDNVLDEMADVIISVNILQDILGISKEDLEERLHKKMYRNMKRLELGDVE